MPTNKKILINQDEIMDYIGIKSNKLFVNFIRSGMPAKKINDRWYAHGENLDEYFKRFTKVRNKSVPSVIK